MGDVLEALQGVLRSRLTDPPEGSYSVTLLRDGEQARRMIIEEAFEVTLELGRDPVDPARTAEEAADLVFHLLAGLVGAGVAWEDVVAELERRRG